MSVIALHSALRKLGLDHQAAKEAVTDVASSTDAATKSDITELKADITELKADNKAIKWMLGLLLAINVAFIVSAVSLLVKFV